VRRDREKTVDYFRPNFRIEPDSSLRIRHPEILDLVPSPNGESINILSSNFGRLAVGEWLISRLILQETLKPEEENILVILASQSEELFSVYTEIRKSNFLR
jgi:hypothetical protein